MMSNAEYRTTNHQMMNVGMSAAQLHRQQATPAGRGEDAPGYRRSSANLSVDCNSNNESNETTSTATTSSERSSQPLQQGQPPLDPSLGVESVMMHTRTNFGATQTYLPPATKTYPYSVPTGAPATSPPKPYYAVTPPSSSNFSVKDKQQQQQQQTKGRSLTLAREDDNDYSDSMDHSPARNTTVSSIMSTPPRTPLDAKLLQFYDSPTTAMSVGGVEGQLPFDQVWNNQEFVLGEDEDEADPALSTAPRNRAHRSNGALPFDEAPEEQSGGASAFSIISSSAPPPPPPPALMTPTQKARLIINARFNNKQNHNHNDFLRPSPDASRGAHRADPPEVRHFVPTTETAASTRRILKHPVLVSPNGDEEDSDPVDQFVEETNIQNDDDIPSDEDETKRNRRQQQQQQSQPMRDTTRDNRHISLATASRRKTAEDVGHRMAVEDLSSHILGSTNYEYDDNEYDVHPEDSRDLNNSYNHHNEEEEETTAGADDDSLFDFKEQLSRSQSNGSWKEPGGRHAVEEEVSLEDDDYYHQRHPGGVAASTACLKTRAQEAFAYRRRFSPKNKNGSLNIRPLSPRSQQPRTPLPSSAVCGGDAIAASGAVPVKPSKASVSFGAINTIHHFEQHEEDLYSDQDESVLSQEQKTIGSDVEDAIRDIFMINALGSCNPSPRRQRRIRHHAERRDEHRDVDHSDTSDVEDDEDDDEDTLQSEEDHQTTRRRSKSNAGGNSRSKENVKNEAKESPQSEDAFYETMMSMMEGGIGAMSAVLGFASSADAAEEGGDGIARAPVTATEEEIPVDYTSPYPSSGSPKRSSPSNGATRSSPGKASSSPRALPTLPQKEERRGLDKQESGNNGVFDAMSDFVLGMDKSESYDELEPPRLNRPAGNKTEPGLEPAQEAELDYDDTFQIVAQADEEIEPQSLEEDPRILELAKQAALCMHEVQGAKYDESRDVEIADIQFSVVELALPLGIIFQEDYSGCWVTKVMPKGNAHLSGTVAPGDQLAAINGKSAIGMKVDDICEAITEPGSHAESIGLTFLRYTGPFLPLPADVHIDLADTEAVYEDDDSIYTYPPDGESVIVHDEKPRSTISIADGKDSKVPNQKTEQTPSTPKRGRMKFKKWFKLGKKNASKAE